MVETVLECLRLQCPVGETSPGYVMHQVEDQRKPCRNSCVLTPCLKNCPGYGVLLVAGRLSWNSSSLFSGRRKLSCVCRACGGWSNQTVQECRTNQPPSAAPSPKSCTANSTPKKPIPCRPTSLHPPLARTASRIPGSLRRRGGARTRFGLLYRLYLYRTALE